MKKLKRNGRIQLHWKEEIVPDIKLTYEDLESKVEYQQQYIEQLQHMVAEFRRNRFGVKSEKFDNPLQKHLEFDDPDKPLENSLDVEEEITVPAHKRKKKSKSNKELPKRIVIIPVEECDKQCACGEKKTVIRYEISERLHYQPAAFEIIEEQREVVACQNDCEQSITTAAAPKRILPKVPVTNSLLAHIIVSKCDDRQPLYHLEKQFSSRYGINISRQNMSRWVVDSAKPLMPLLNGLKDSIIDYDVASMDATTLQVLNEPDRSPTTKSYAYCFRGGGVNHEAIVYEYNEKEHKQFVKNWFAGFAGAVHSDADSFFGDLYAQEEVSSLLCNAHARRKFEAITKTTKKKGLAHHAMSVYTKLYAIERKARAEKLSDQQYHELREKHALPLLDKFKEWLDRNSLLVPPQSPIAKAINYTLRHWEGLTRYLTDGRYLIDNNHTEREIKPFVIARKNFLFAGSQEGARALCLHFSLIRSAKLHKLDPFQYYVKVMEIIPYCQTADDYEALLPWNIDLEKVAAQD